MQHQRVLILDFGGQYNQLIARRVRELNVFCDLLPSDMSLQKIKEYNPIGIIFTGGPNSVYDEGSPKIDKGVFDLGIPVLGICYGCQLMAYTLGGEVQRASTSEYGKAEVEYVSSHLTVDMPSTAVCWMSHTDRITRLPEGFKMLAKSANCPYAAFGDEQRKLYGVQFHPEVNHTFKGTVILKNFLYNICGATGDWTMSNFVANQIAALKEKIGDKKVLCAMSGGVDSAVAATLIHKAVGDQLTCVFVDHGLLRKYEADEVMSVFKDGLGMNLIKADDGAIFLEKLKGVTDPETKRKIIGSEFIEVFKEEAQKLEDVKFLAQGTIYPDIIESEKGVKAHHNVGGLPEQLGFELVEPLKFLYKDEVRVVGDTLGLPANMVYRQPFPGPGLGVRCLGAITRDRLECVRRSDAILREEFAKNGLEGKVWQYFTVVPDFKSVGVKDGKRTFAWPVILRAVNTKDAMTATVEDIPFALLQHITERITGEVEGVNRVLYDLTPKPCGTIEWE